MEGVLEYEALWNQLEAGLVGPDLDRFRLAKSSCIASIKDMREHMPFDIWMKEGRKMTERLVSIASGSQKSDELFRERHALFRDKVVGGAQTKSYAEAFTDGIVTGFKGVGEMIAHPIETLIKPPVEFAADFAILGARGYLDACEASRPGVKLNIDASSARKRMKERIEDVRALKDAFIEGSGPERVEMATALITTMAIGHRVISAVRVPIKRDDLPLTEMMAHLRAMPDRVECMAFYDLARKTPKARYDIPSQGVRSKSLSERASCIFFEEDGLAKEVIHKSGDPARILSQIAAVDELGQALIHGRVPRILGINTQGDYCWDLYLAKVPGQTMKDLLAGKDITQIEQGFYQLGKVVGEMNTKKCGPMTHSEWKNFSTLPRSYRDLSALLEKEYDLKLPYASEEIAEITRRFEMNPVCSSLSHDDPHLGNFIWDKKARALTLIDIGERDPLRGSKAVRKPVGYAYHMLLKDIEEAALDHPLKASIVKKAYRDGYQEVFSASPEYDEFVRIFVATKYMEYGVVNSLPSKEEIQALLKLHF